MRWPLRRRPRAAPVAPPADAPAERPPRREPHPERSRPRADWARLDVLRPASATPPLTFHGERFGRSVAGARPLLLPMRPRRSGSAPAGVLLDVAAVETIVPPPSAHPAAAPTTATPSAEPTSSTHSVAPHRPAVRRRTTDPLVRADGALAPFDWSPAEPRSQPLPDVPLMWTPADGFQEITSSGRRVRPRPTAPSVLPPEPNDDASASGDGAPSTGPLLRFVPTAAPRRVGPPADLIAAVVDATGVDVADALIDRGPDVSIRAAELGALAYTDGRTVHLPEELGSLDDRGVRAVAAHELVHVAQRRRLGGELPPEASDAGHALEIEAARVERAVAGGGVAPTFVRAAAHAPTGEPPVGILRRAQQPTAYLGEDLSRHDLLDVAPGSPSDPFTWQRRPAEPSPPASNEQRWSYGSAYERQYGNLLQSWRDEEYMGLLAQALREAAPQGQEPTPDLVTQELLDHVARELDAAKPYQHGAPAGIAPYPQLPFELPPDPAEPTARTGTPRTAPRQAPVVPRSSPGAPDAAAAQATAAAELLGRADLTLRHAVDANQGPRAIESQIVARFDRERALRRQVLVAMATAARAADAASTDPIQLGDDQLAWIREVVDAEYPLRNVATVPYLPTTELMWVSHDGQTFDVPGIDDRMPHRSRGARAGMSVVGPLRAGAGGATRPGSSDAATAEAQAVERQIEEDAQEFQATHTDPLEPAGQLSYGELVQRYEQRMNLEQTMRQNVLTEKVRTAISEGAAAGHVVALTPDDHGRIREEVDRLLPVPAPAQYRPLDGDLRHRLTNNDVANRPAPAVAAAADSPTTAADSTTAVPSASATAPPTAAPVAPAAPATAAGGVHAVAQPEATAPTAPPGQPTAPATTEHPAAPPPGRTSALTNPVEHFLHGSAHAHDELATQMVDALGEVELEKLARRLYGRIRRELRTELLIDRERAGVLADIR